MRQVLSTTRIPSIERAMRLLLAAVGKNRGGRPNGVLSRCRSRIGLNTSRYVFDAHVRALEMVPGAAKELMIGNLDVALNMPEVEPQERQRLKEFVTLTAEAMRTRELAEFLDALLTGEEDLFAMIEAPLEVRLLACYQNVLVEPPIHADAVVRWIDNASRRAGRSRNRGPGNDVARRRRQARRHRQARRAAAGQAGQSPWPSPTAFSAGQLDREPAAASQSSLCAAHADNDNSGRAASMLIELDKLVR